MCVVGRVLGEEIGGKLELWEAGGGIVCTINITPGIYDYYMDRGCEDDAIDGFRLVDVKSAVFILFGSEDENGKCPSQEDDGWQLEIKTIKNNFTTDRRNFDGLARDTIGKVHSPGYVKTFERDLQDVNYHNKLSCVTTFWCPVSQGPAECHDPQHKIHHDQPRAISTPVPFDRGVQ
jgi:hypothetical protein